MTADSYPCDLFCLRARFPSLSRDFLHHDPMILQRIRIIVGDAGFEPGTSHLKPGALPMSDHISQATKQCFGSGFRGPLDPLNPDLGAQKKI